VEGCARVDNGERCEQTHLYQQFTEGGAEEVCIVPAP
jgi:hypothetical protein